ncbi:GlxA family transcriptional regulator [Roseovarius sp. EL26]|uniref:GlxA family transcriptional regulator n=1 Tax=Roseovarius sp. EL26 TaxID=2126672 RepID=UPI000EA05971|nr:GlxA family transcriptional regulator [Roseovarius sp. EL26]
MSSTDAQGPRPTRIVCILVPRFNMMSVVSLLEPLRIANYLSPSPLYETTFCATDAGEVWASNGMPIRCEGLPEKLNQDDLVLLIGSWGAEHYSDTRLLSWLRRADRQGIRQCAVEMAPYIFARAGLLTGRRATVHWSYLPGFKEVFPDINGQEQLFTSDGRIMTCAGSSAGLDFMLDQIRQNHGDALVGEISDNILHHPVRDSTHSQRKTLGHGLEGLPQNVSTVVELMDQHLVEPLTVPQLAEQVGISQRQLERQFNTAIGCSVVQFGLLLRLQHARVLLISTDLGVREIATASGFNSLSHFAYSFRKCFGRKPREYRQAWPKHKEAPDWPGTLSNYLETLKLKQHGLTPIDEAH